MKYSILLVGLGDWKKQVKARKCPFVSIVYKCSISSFR